MGDAPPAAVTGLSTRTGGGSGEVLLTWRQNAEPDVVRYVVLRADIPGGPTTEVGSATRAQVDLFESGVPFVDSTAKVGYYSVRAVDAAGNVGVRSAEVCGAAPGNSCTAESAR